MNSRHVTIIYNPISGRSGRRAQKVRTMIELLATRGIDAEAWQTEGPEHAADLARQAAEEGVNTIVSYGGDGTLNEVLQGMAGTHSSLAVWPGGTANVVATDLAIPFDVKRLADTIAAGKTKRISLGLARRSDVVRGDGETGREGEGARRDRETGRVGDGANVAYCETSIVTGAEVDGGNVALSPPRPLAPSRSGLIASRYFVMMAGIGLDASIARGVNKRLKRRTGEFAYWVTGINHIFTWRGEPFTIDVDGTCYESTFALIGNGKGYGGGLRITPGARLEDPWFQVYIVPPLRNNVAYLRTLAGCMRGKPETCGARLVRGSHIKASSEYESWVEADGEVIGTLPMTFEVVPDALSIIVP